MWKEQEGARCFKWRSDWPCRPFVSPGGRVHPLCAPRLPWASFRVNVPDSTDYLLWRLSTCLKNPTPPCLNSQVLLSELRGKASEAYCSISQKKKEWKEKGESSTLGGWVQTNKHHYIPLFMPDRLLVDSKCKHSGPTTVDLVLLNALHTF